MRTLASHIARGKSVSFSNQLLVLPRLSQEVGEGVANYVLFSLARASEIMHNQPLFNARANETSVWSTGLSLRPIRRPAQAAQRSRDSTRRLGRLRRLCLDLLRRAHCFVSMSRHRQVFGDVFAWDTGFGP
jgi:hypothetical protein